MWGQPPPGAKRSLAGLTLRLLRSRTCFTPAAKRRKNAAHDASRGWQHEACEQAPEGQKKIRSVHYHRSNPLPRADRARFSQTANQRIPPPTSARRIQPLAKPAIGKASKGSTYEHCTKSCHRLVDGVHSIENTCTYKRVFFVDEKNRKSRTESFFDSF